MGRHTLLLMLILGAILFKEGAASRLIANEPRRKLLTTQSCDAAADYALVLDSSGSLTETGFHDLKTAAYAVLSATRNAANQYYANIFSDNVKIIMQGWGNEAVAQLALSQAPYLNGNTNMYEGMDDAKAKFAQASPNTVKLCFLITDGKYNDGGDPTPVANDMKAAGVTIITIGVGTGVDEGFLKSIASREDLYFPVASTAVLVQQIRDIVHRVCPLVCKDEHWALTTTTDSCSLPACTPALLASGAKCFNAYDSGAQGSPVVFEPAGPLVVDAGQTQDFLINVTFGSQTPCLGHIGVTCQCVECTRTPECYLKLEDIVCANRVCENNHCVYQNKPMYSSCNDTNPCTTRDHCDGRGQGSDHCVGTPKNCAFTAPPTSALRQCYDVPYCDENDGKCVWPFSSAALKSVISANAYCSTWAGAFAAQLVSDGTTPNPSGSIAYSDCYSACNADVCAKMEPACSCITSAASSSRAMAGTCPPCPWSASGDSWCDTLSCVSSPNGLVFTFADGSNPNATCWYPDPNVKSGAGGMLYPCNGRVYTEYALTGGTAVSQCMGCLALGYGSAYDRNSSTCYAGNITHPVDP